MSIIKDDGHIDNFFQNFIAVSRYARFDEDKGARDSWRETVEKYFRFMVQHLSKTHGYEMTGEMEVKLKQAITNLEVLPSMRTLMSAHALHKNAIANYNCSYIPIDSVEAFDELMIILMSGTGVGISVERQYVENLPTVAKSIKKTSDVVVVEDSREGWASAFRSLLNHLYNGRIPKIDVTKVRPAGARLKTFGGRASGPQPLINLFDFAISTFKDASGRKLKPIECHDIATKVGEVVIAGSVRRSAIISFSDLDDDEMAKAKDGPFWEKAPQRSMANNSAVYFGRPDRDVFDKEWTNLVESGTGERGIFNVHAAQAQASQWGRRSPDAEYRANPCNEILLNPYQFCNLSTVPIRGDETLDEMKNKVEMATILGTFQSTVTDFEYIRDKWKETTESERLLGVSMTGIFGHPVLNGSKGQPELENWLRALRNHARAINRKLSEKIGIPESAAITCIKPEGNSSSLTGTSSGIHPWHNDYYIRTVRSDKKDPLGQFMKDSGIPVEDDVISPDQSDVFSFPVKAPVGAITRKDINAIKHLELWLTYQRHWCEHKPSITVSVKEEEWDEVGDWVWDHFDEVSGIAFLPHSEHIYQQAPYQDITKEEYDEFVKKMPKDIDWTDLSFYESDDSAVIAGRELACSAGGCDVIDLGLEQ